VDTGARGVIAARHEQNTYQRQREEEIHGMTITSMLGAVKSFFIHHTFFLPFDQQALYPQSIYLLLPIAS
jgi:hypothetical protein